MLMHCFYRQKVGGIVDEGDYYRFANGRYDEKGFTYKNFSINALVSFFYSSVKLLNLNV